MSKKIVMHRGSSIAIAREFKVTPQMVNYSINFKKDSILAKEIRKVAKERYGGVEVEY